ncbi:ABC transporter substrate-binding protein [Panacibacter ginsenosidivorans]|uniref:ABC transporter substrate-binding protein n=1 Tax=Panacibacter ginsenosidivorans TaxID=1813871 RepID=A0A5B8V542_9BACT|nr:ABC transporter substrate-binding protein [Panacibacter ginsenosidivorans]QEC65923.1 ABC transporter substrate-binding protein [Panacibacter ginsenosidivorans]
MKIFFAVLLALQVSCNNQKQTDKQVFYYNETTGVATLDPAFARNQSIMWVVHQLYNTLVEIDSNLHIVPSLAKSWEISNDRLLYTFHLRTDVYFQNNEIFTANRGRKFTAQDVVYSLQRIRNNSTASSGAWIFNGKIDSVKGFTALNDSTFQIKLLRPFQPVLGILSMQYCSIIAHEAIEKYGKDFRSHPCGTGPFQLKYWDEGQVMVLEKNEHYWEKDANGKTLPYLDAVKISFYDNKATEFLEFRQGRLSFVNDIDPSFKDEILTKKGDLRPEWIDKIKLDKHAYLNTEYFGILADTQNNLVKTSPLKIKAVRQAINYAINREQLIMYMRNSIGTAAEAGIVPLGLPSLNAEMVTGYNYNPQKAKALLTASGVDSKNMPAIQLLTIPIYADIASFVARQVEEVGLNVKVEVIQKSLLLQQTAKQQALFFRASWIADYPDTENYMTIFYSKNPAPPNYTRYKNPAFDKLYEQALQETDDSLRYALYRQMDQIVIDDAPVVPLWYDEVIHLVQNNIEGFNSNALNLLELRKTQIR